MASGRCVGQRPDGHAFLCKFDIFKRLYLAYYWVYLHQTWGFCKAWSARFGSIIANPIIYRLVPSPSRFETRQCVIEGIGH